jgi:hypothetical protein
MKKTLSESKKDIRQLLKTYEKSIVSNDEVMMMSVHHDSMVNFIAVDPLQRLGDNYTNNGIQVYSYLGNLKWGMMTQDVVSEERMRDLEIITDGEVATVMYKYAFYNGNVPENWGNTIVQLVNTGEKWQVVAHVFSTTSGGDSR